jgi:nucleotide-binding universal stress UspA family protein
MTDIKRILCPVDFSEFSRHAVDHAVALARSYGATVTALHVIPSLPMLIPTGGDGLYPPIAFTPDDLEQFRTELRSFVADGSAAVRMDTVVEQGAPAQEILRHAAALPADVIVMGTHGRSGFERLLVGSVTERVLLKARCPVLTVPRHAPDAVPAGPVLFARILCAVDFSPSSDKALEYAGSLASQAHGHLTVMHVIEPVPMTEPVMMGGSGTQEFDRVALDVGRTILHEAVGDGVRASCTVTELVSRGKPYREILRVAEEEKAELIVIGAHGGAVGLGSFGSTTNHVVRRATCPVFTLRA